MSSFTMVISSTINLHYQQNVNNPCKLQELQVSESTLKSLYQAELIQMHSNPRLTFREGQFYAQVYFSVVVQWLEIC